MPEGLPPADVPETSASQKKSGVHQTVEMIDAQVAHAEQTLEGIGQVFARVERAKPVLDGKVQNIGAKSSSGGSSSGPAPKTSGEPTGRISITQREPAQVINSLMGVLLGGIFLAGYTLTAEETNLLVQAAAVLVPLALNWFASREIRAKVTPIKG